VGGGGWAVVEKSALRKGGWCWGLENGLSVFVWV